MYYTCKVTQLTGKNPGRVQTEDREADSAKLAAKIAVEYLCNGEEAEWEVRVSTFARDERELHAAPIKIATRISLHCIELGQ